MGIKDCIQNKAIRVFISLAINTNMGWSDSNIRRKILLEDTPKKNLRQEKHAKLAPYSGSEPEEVILKIASFSLQYIQSILLFVNAKCTKAIMYVLECRGNRLIE